MAKKKKSGKKRKANPMAKRAMELVRSRGVSLKEAWRLVKGGKAKAKAKPKKKRKAKARKAPKKARKARAKTPKKKRRAAKAKPPKKTRKARSSTVGGLPRVP